MKYFVCFPIAFLCIPVFMVTQNGTKTLNIRDAVWKARTEYSPERLGTPQFLSDNTTISYVHKNNLYIIQRTHLKPMPVCSLYEINKNYKAYTKDTLPGFPPVQWQDKNSFYFIHKGKKYTFSLTTRKISESDPDKMIQEEHMDEFEKNKKYAFVRNHQLFVYHNANEYQITDDGSEEIVYGQSVHQNEFGITKGTFWSPKGNFLAFYRMDQSKVFKYPIVDWTTYPATSRTLIYPMNGNTSHTVQVGIYSLQEGKVVYLKTIPDEHYLTNLSWSPDEKFILLAELNRDQNHMSLNMYDVSTGKFIKTLFEEKDSKYVEPLNPALFLKNNPQRFIWQSRRNGYNHLYLYDTSGRLVRQLTDGAYEVKQVFGMDKKARFVYFASNEGNPIGQDIYRVSLVDGKKERITNGKGYHSAMFNEDFTGMLDVWSTVYTPRVSDFWNLENKTKTTLLESENPLKEYALGKWEVFKLKSSDGFDLYSRIFYPVAFDSTRKYPVLVYLYNGPHSQMVTDNWMGGGEVWYQYMAQKGFIVFTIDGRGTSYRGKEFEQKIFRQLGKVEMEDQLTGVRWLKSKKFVDSTRMGVYGWSYGGFMTLSLMTRFPGVFKAAVAGGPVVDWRYYEIMYGERYMDTYETNKEGFEENSLLNHIQNLKGNLLVIHGAIDPVVVWQHTMLLLKRAIEKGVHFDYYVYPHHEHNVLGKDRAHLMEKITEYFLEKI